VVLGNNLKIVEAVKVGGAEARRIKQNGNLVWRSSSRKQWPWGRDCHREDKYRIPNVEKKPTDVICNKIKLLHHSSAKVSTTQSNHV
jgi:hypothetical protein